MKFITSISLLFLTATTSSAFAPVQTRGVQKTTYSPEPRVANDAAMSKTVLFSDKLADQLEKNAEKAKEKADKVTKFLIVDVAEAQNELAKNWGLITTAGVATMALGAAALLLPIVATEVAYDGTVLTLGATGAVSLLSAIFREKGNKLKVALSGLLYCGVSYYMGTHPGTGLNIITLTIATTIAAEGLYEAILAVKNENLQARPWHFVTGVGSVLASLWLTANIPVSSLFAPGAALGYRLTSSGATKVAVGLAGKELADQRKDSN